MSAFSWSDGWLTGVRRVESPNFDARPPAVTVDLVVVHNISLPPGCYGGDEIERLFTNRLTAGEHAFLDTLLDARVSTHFFIDRAGRSTHFVSCLQRAWHAGASAFRGRSRCNDYSIGIELEGTDFEPFAKAQYPALNHLLDALARAFPIDAIVGHSDIATERKTDPGPFFLWDRVRRPAARTAR